MKYGYPKKYVNSLYNLLPYKSAILHSVTIPQLSCYTHNLPTAPTLSRIIGVVREAHSQLWVTVIPVFSPYAPRKYDKRFGTPAIV